MFDVVYLPTPKDINPLTKEEQDRIDEVNIELCGHIVWAVPTITHIEIRMPYKGVIIFSFHVVRWLRNIEYSFSRVQFNDAYSVEGLAEVLIELIEAKREYLVLAQEGTEDAKRKLLDLVWEAQQIPFR